MPILAVNRARYPDDWPVISLAVKDRAGWRCECTGECGRVHEHLSEVDGRCRNHHGRPRWRGQGHQCSVVLTTAHLNHTPEDVDPDNLRAFCEGCHLGYDRRHHAATRRARREAALGLVPLFELA